MNIRRWQKVIIGVTILIISAFIFAAVPGCTTTEEAPPETTKEAPPETTKEAPPETIEAITLTFACPFPEQDYRPADIYMPWFADIEEATGGAVKVQPYWAASLCTMQEAYSAVVSGLADMSHIDPFHVAGQFPLTELQMMSSFDKKVWRPSRVYAELYEKFPEIQAEHADMKILAFVSSHTSWLATTGKAIRTLEDCAGQKWNGPGVVFAMRAEAVGAVPMNVTPPEVYSATEKGVVDGGGTQLAWLWSLKLGELYKYINSVPFTGTPLFVGMNWEKWNSLSPDIQEAIEEVSGLIEADRADTVEELTAQTGRVQAIEEFGIEFVDLPPEELARWVEADQAVVEALIAEREGMGLPASEFFEEFRRLEEKYSAPEWEITP